MVAEARNLTGRLRCRGCPRQQVRRQCPPTGIAGIPAEVVVHPWHIPEVEVAVLVGVGH